MSHPHTQQQQQQHQQYRETKLTQNPATTSHRRSISMETFQSEHLEAGPQHHQPQQSVPHSASNQSNYYNKFGTISGFSTKKLTDLHHQQQNNITLSAKNNSNNQYTNKTYLSTNFNNELKVMNIALNSINGTTNAKSNLNNQKNNNNGMVQAATASLDANSRFRAINRSFRTAVDKSFDMPSNSGIFFLCFLILHKCSISLLKYF